MGLGNAMFKGAVEQAQYDDLEKQRALKLQQMQDVNDVNEYNFDRTKQRNSYQDDQRKTAEQLLQQANEKEKVVKKQVAQLATNNIDNAILESGKNNYEPLKKILLNKTEGNPNKDVKDLIEQQLGGTIVNVGHPNPENTAEGEEIQPDTVEVEVLDDTGERKIHHMSAMQLGILMGTPNRVGTKAFHNSLDGSQIPKETPMDLAKKLSVTFDGKISGLKENLTLAASVGNDPQAKKLLALVTETSAKDGDSLLKALTAEYGTAKTPQDRAKVLSRINKVNSLMQAINGKKEKQDEELTKSKLQGKLAQAVLDNDEEGITKYTKALSAINTAGKAPTALTKDQLQVKKDEKLDNEFKATNTYKNIVEGKSDSELAVKKISSGAQWQAKANALLEADRVIQADKQGEHTIDLSAPNTRTGKVGVKGKRVLDYLHKVEEAGRPDLANTQVKKSLDLLKGTKTLMGSMSKTLKIYDTVKSSGLLKGTERSGVAYMIKEGLKTFIGDPDKGKGAFKSMEHDIDRIHELQDKKSLTYSDRRELKDLRSRYLQNSERAMKTENYFNLKKLLQSISGMGVTNKELEGFKQYFGGSDYASLDAMTAKLKEATLAQLHIANGEFNTLVSAGMPYTAYKSILDLRHEGEYLINGSPDRAVDRGLNYTVTVAHPMEKTKVYKASIDKFAQQTGASTALVKTLSSKLLSFQMQGINKLSDIYARIPDITNTQKKLIKQLIPVLTQIDKVSTENDLYNNNPKESR